MKKRRQLRSESSDRARVRVAGVAGVARVFLFGWAGVGRSKGGGVIWGEGEGGRVCESVWR
jgi:hypothetical protein